LILIGFLWLVIGVGFQLLDEDLTVLVACKCLSFVCLRVKLCDPPWFMDLFFYHKGHNGNHEGTLRIISQPWRRGFSFLVLGLLGFYQKLKYKKASKCKTYTH